MPNFTWDALGGAKTLSDVMGATQLFPSKKEVRRLIEQGAVKVNREKVSDHNEELNGEIVVQVGKRVFFKVN